MGLLNYTTGQDYDTSSDQLAGLSWNQLLAMRNSNPEAQFQQLIASYEHRAYAREQVAANPLMAPMYAGVLIPGYQAAKASGLLSARTPASLDELMAGQHGVAEGLADWWRRLQASPDTAR